MLLVKNYNNMFEFVKVFIMYCSLFFRDAMYIMIVLYECEILKALIRRIGFTAY